MKEKQAEFSEIPVTAVPLRYQRHWGDLCCKIQMDIAAGEYKVYVLHNATGAYASGIIRNMKKYGLKKTHASMYIYKNSCLPKEEKAAWVEKVLSEARALDPNVTKSTALRRAYRQQFVPTGCETDGMYLIIPHNCPLPVMPSHILYNTIKGGRKKKLGVKRIGKVVLEHIDCNVLTGKERRAKLKRALFAGTAGVVGRSRPENVICVDPLVANSGGGTSAREASATLNSARYLAKKFRFSGLFGIVTLFRRGMSYLIPMPK